VILANATANFTAEFLLALLSAVGFLAWIYSSLKSATGRAKREVSFTETYATKEEIQRIERNVEKLERKMETNLDSIRAEMKADSERLLNAGESRASKLHGRIDQVLEAVAELRGWSQNK
jgi:hypothetical protein